MSLVETYESLGLNLHKPSLRAAMEADISAIAQGEKSKNEVIRSML